MSSPSGCARRDAALHRVLKKNREISDLHGARSREAGVPQGYWVLRPTRLCHRTGITRTRRPLRHPRARKVRPPQPRGAKIVASIPMHLPTPDEDHCAASFRKTPSSTPTRTPTADVVCCADAPLRIPHAVKEPAARILRDLKVDYPRGRAHESAPGARRREKSSRVHQFWGRGNSGSAAGNTPTTTDFRARRARGRVGGARSG